MELSTAVFHKTHDPLTIQQVEIDKPGGARCCCRTVATAICT